MSTRQYTVRDGLMYVTTDGEAPECGRFVILKEDTGEIVAEHKNDGEYGPNWIHNLWYMVGDKIICRANPNHGPGFPWVLWRVKDNKIEQLPSALNSDREYWAKKFWIASSYEVHMQFPIVDGRMIIRTDRGSVMCLDLRKK
jgi:hypothetical protein